MALKAVSSQVICELASCWQLYAYFLSVQVKSILTLSAFSIEFFNAVLDILLTDICLGVHCEANSTISTSLGGRESAVRINASTISYGNAA